MFGNRTSLPIGDYALPWCYTQLNTESLETTKILQVQNQPALNLRGQGVILGFLDSGIELKQMTFRKADGKTRVLELWDQTDQSGRSPEGFQYGSVYTSEDIDKLLAEEQEVLPGKDENGHGTFLAGIAAGRQELSGGEAFTGAAPRAFIAAVKLKPAKQYLRDYYVLPDSAEAYQENDIMMGMKYLLSLARTKKLPLTILLALGTNLGSHEGTSPLAQYLDTISNFPGIITVTAAGNETGYSHHFFGTIGTDEEFEDAELRVAEGEAGFTLELWSQEPELFSIGFLSPTGEQISRIPNNTLTEQRITFVLENTVIYLNYQVAEAGTGSQLIVMRFVNPTPGIWRIRVYNSLYLRGEYHLWLPSKGFISDDTFFLRPSPDTVVTEPGNASQTITAGAFNHRSGGIYIHSSRGYTRLGRVKPDLAAPGVNVDGPGIQGAAGFPMRAMTGTSAAASHVAGAAANLLSWAFREDSISYMNTSVAKTYLIRGADRNHVFAYPNREWGYGTLNLYGAFLRLRE